MEVGMTTHYRNAIPEGMSDVGAPSPFHFLDNARHGVESALEALHQWSERARERRQLVHMSARELKDIGITRNEAKQEYRKPFWKI